MTVHRIPPSTANVSSELLGTAAGEPTQEEASKSQQPEVQGLVAVCGCHALNLPHCGGSFGVTNEEKVIARCAKTYFDGG